MDPEDLRHQTVPLVCLRLTSGMPRVLPLPQSMLDINIVGVAQRAPAPSDASRLSGAISNARLPPLICQYPRRRQELVK
jgi:hypothetical protein